MKFCQACSHFCGFGQSAKHFNRIGSNHLLDAWPLQELSHLPGKVIPIQRNKISLCRTRPHVFPIRIALLQIQPQSFKSVYNGDKSMLRVNRSGNHVAYGVTQNKFWAQRRPGTEPFCRVGEKLRKHVCAFRIQHFKCLIQFRRRVINDFLSVSPHTETMIRYLRRAGHFFNQCSHAINVCQFYNRLSYLIPFDGAHY